MLSERHIEKEYEFFISFGSGVKAKSPFLSNVALAIRLADNIVRQAEY